jgi:tetratricopeptide (TPR) repeat protein
MQLKHLKSFSGTSQWVLLVTIFVFFATWTGISLAQSTTNDTASNEIRIVELQGTVEISNAGTTIWTHAPANQVLHPFDRLRTGENSRVALRWSDQSIVPFGASTELEVLPPNLPDAQCGLHLIRGIISFFHRDKPGKIQIITRGAVAGVEGTEFVMSVNDADVTTLSLVDGKVRFGNEQATLILTNGQQAVAEPGKSPTRTAGFVANNLLQWCFYYPAVIDPDELQFTTDEQKNLADSFAAYRNGDLHAALKNYPAGRKNISNRERFYKAALLLSVGEVENAESALSSISEKDERAQQLANALRQLIAVVKRQPVVVSTNPKLASELLAESYAEQSRAIRETSLQNALNFARQAANVSPKFGFAWERVAELEFSFGRTKDALTDLDKSLALAPRNAQALALKGFLLAAQNQTREAVNWFDRALAADSALGNAWLGRGLCRIRNGDANGGREDLLVAAALEPQRAELRSYLGKAYANAGDFPRATKELQLAKKLDPNDPTAWLYSALLDQENNQVNDSIRDLEKSQALNDNRSVYRSQLLLDQESAVRSANLAGMYQDAGMFDLSLREAGRAVSSDYANYSAHLFLASSYEQLRDPNWSNLRYDTPAAAEFWIANLLAPTGAGWLSSAIAQQPYSRLFDQNRFGFISDTTYLSRGAWTEQADQYYTSGNFSYDVGTSYRYDPGQRPNNDFESREVDVNLKGQLTSQDSIFAAIQIAEVNYGDNNEYYNQASASPDFHFDEKQEPNVFLGYHHEWSPGVHTLFLASRQTADELVNAPNAGVNVASYNQSQEIWTADIVMDNSLLVKLSPEVYSTELQQIWEQATHTTSIGARYEWGNIRFQNYEVDSPNDDGAWGDIFFPNTSPLIISQDFKVDFHHFNVYGYHTWQIADPLALTVGLSYDWLHQPADVVTEPFSQQEKTRVQLSPKAGFIWMPLANMTLRGAYTRSLSDLSNGQDTRLEPTEIAGFNQAFRSLVPESVVGDTTGSRFDTFDLSLEQKFDTGTYLGLSGEILYSKLNELEGGFVYFPTGPAATPPSPIGLNKSLDYRERSLTFTVDQLLGKQWTAGVRYRVAQADLNSSYVDMNPATLSNVDPSFHARQNLDSVLHMVNLHANWNHPSGLFSVLEGNWYHQSNSGFSPAEPGDDFWQFNAYAGCRFWHRRAEFTVGLLNITGQNYQLEPLNLYNEVARSRTFLARLLISF